MKRPSFLRLLTMSGFLAMLVLAGCGRENPPAERQEQRGAAGEQDTKRDASHATIPKVEVKGVGDTTEVGPFLVTLNGAEDRLSEDQNPDHHYAVADLTLESKAGDTLDASEAGYMLRDEEGYSFEMGSLSEQKPRPQGQVMPGGKASGEVAFDLGTEPIKGPLALAVSLTDQPDAVPAVFEFALRPAREKPEPKPKAAEKPEPKVEKDEPEPKGANAGRSRPAKSGYRVVTDPSGGLTVEVPLDWEAETGEASEGGDGTGSWSYYAGEYITASITAARSLDAWKELAEGPTPGTYMVASRTLAQNHTDEELIYSLLFANKANKCAEGPYEEFGRGPYSLTFQEWHACGINDTTSLVVVAAPEGRECVVVMDIILASEKTDLEATQRILDSFEVDCGALPPPAPADFSASATSEASASGSASASQSAEAEGQAASCGDFRTMSGEPSQWQAQQYYDFEATPEEKAILDPDGNGFACDDSAYDANTSGENDTSSVPPQTSGCSDPAYKAQNPGGCGTEGVNLVSDPGDNYDQGVVVGDDTPDCARSSDVLESGLCRPGSAPPAPPPSTPGSERQCEPGARWVGPNGPGDGDGDGCAGEE